MAGRMPENAAGIAPGGTEACRTKTGMTKASGKKTGGKKICGDMIFALAERQDRLSAQIHKKIERLDRRITELENRGRS
jgi:hypothetical protein